MSLTQQHREKMYGHYSSVQRSLQHCHQQGLLLVHYYHLRQILADRCICTCSVYYHWLYQHCLLCMLKVSLPSVRLFAFLQLQAEADAASDHAVAVVP